MIAKGTPVPTYHIEAPPICNIASSVVGENAGTRRDQTGLPDEEASSDEDDEEDMRSN
jgi:hypothetical protein